MHAVPLFDEQLMFVCSLDLLSERPLAAAADLAHHALLHPTRDHRDWKLWLDHAGANEIDATLGPTFETLDLATNAAMQGFGVAISDRTLVSEDVAARRLVMPFDTVLETGSRYYFVYPDCVANQPKVKLFSDWITRNRDAVSAVG